MRNIIVIGMIALSLVSCASIKTAKDDIQTGYTTPLADGEVSPQEQARPIASAATGAITTVVPVTMPFATPINEAIAGALGLFFAWQRGRSIRKQQPVSSNPITGYIGNKTGLESIIQNISTVASGITEVFKEGSTAQHAWQGVLTGLTGLAGTAFLIPGVRQTLIFHPEFAAYVGIASGFFNGLQQALTQVKPVSEPNV